MTAPQRIAVHIGCNYPGTGSELQGCVNDALDWQEQTKRWGFDDQTLILDSDATKSAMMIHMRAAIGRAKYGDRVVITFSGHGSRVPDRDGDERDGVDEIICPHDIAEGHWISDDDLYEMFRSAAFGARVFFLSDSCHSGTLHRLAPPLSYGHTNMQTEFSSPGGTSMPLPTAYRQPRFLPPSRFLSGDDMAQMEKVQERPVRGWFRRSALVFAACQDDQVTYDANINGRARGIFSYVALKALTDMSEDGNYRGWARKVRNYLPSLDYPDVTPRLDGLSSQRSWRIG